MADTKTLERAGLTQKADSASPSHVTNRGCLLCKETFQTFELVLTDAAFCTKCGSANTRWLSRFEPDAPQAPARKAVRKGRRVAERHASREEQNGRYIDCGPAAWDDR